GLVGPDNMSSKTLHQLGEDKFAAAGLYGKLLNVVGDLDARSVERSDMFKMLTGRDMVDAQHKYRAAFQYIFFGLLAFSANEFPPSADQTKGYFDRWIVLPMTTVFRGTPQEIPFLEQILIDEEIEGIMV